MLSSDDEEDFDGEDEAADGLDEGEEDEIDYEDDDDEVRHGCCYSGLCGGLLRCKEWLKLNASQR